MKSYRKFISIMICCVLAVVNSGCNKQESETEAETLVGTYRLSHNPLYCEVEAIDPNAVALNVDGARMTYSQINALIMRGVSQVVCPNDVDIIFNEDLTVGIKCDGETLVPYPSDDVPADALRYQIVDGRIRLTVAEQLLQKLLRDEDFEYSDVVGADVAVKLNYTLEDGELRLFLDSNSVLEVLDILRQMGEQTTGGFDDKTQQIIDSINTVMPQLRDAILNGYRKFNVGISLTRLQ